MYFHVGQYHPANSEWRCGPTHNRNTLLWLSACVAYNRTQSKEIKTHNKSVFTNTSILMFIVK